MNMSIDSAVFNAPIHLFFTGSILVALALGFLLFFLVPAILFRVRLGLLLRRLKAKKLSDVTEIQKLFQSDPKLRHLWEEFRDTLHEQRTERGGQSVVEAMRLTVSAEAFFNAQFMVDNRLRTEFFKHLPGIFTGIGIIGTFLGLIQGLQAFRVSEDAGKVRESLELLLHGVYEAFLISAIAIALAMVVTFIEKMLLASLYRCTEDLAQYLDSLFQAGAGEEYLSRLVKASEESATQSKILKDSLVGELKVILQELTNQQIQASASNNKSLAKEITEGIRSSLKEPLEKIEGLVSKASGDQSATAAEMLKDVMASFSQRLNDLFGGQIAGLNEINQRAAQSMQEAVAALQQLIGNIESASQRSGDAMSERMAHAVEEMERRQADLNQQTESFVEQIRELVAKSQGETNEKLQSAIGELGKHVAEVIESLQAQSRKVSVDQHTREHAMAKFTEGVMTSMGETVAESVKQMAESTNRMQKSVETLERTTTNAVDKMNSGANTLQQSAISFASAGDKVTGAISQAAGVAEKMAQVSGALTSSATALQTTLADYRANRDATVAMLVEVRAIVESAKQEASMTQEALARIQSSADKLANAQKAADQYLESVTTILTESHQAFADGISRTLDRANSDFHIKLSAAVGLLRSAIEELEASLSSAQPRRT